MQMSAVDLRITAHFTHLGSHGAKTRVWSHSVAVEAAAMGGHTAPYDKMEPTSSVRRPESGTWQSVAMETAAMGGRTGTHDTLWTWQQHEEAVQGPMTDYGPGSSSGRAVEAHGAGWRWRQQQWKAIQHPITKWNPPTV
ncbi:unnamed protein product [Staurois parvus]|uniref:Uncharacterized protein n=1 Tax=Staurois parvus TaxID=386267 RepID=A0ABN9E5J8_9NEOB|nr:unnamed protein product [Staurois parvus]